jgi:hypothetical protein
MDSLTLLERRAIEHALPGPESWMSQLVSRVPELGVLRREDSGGGFYVYFATPEGLSPGEIPAEAYSIPPQCVAKDPVISGEVFFLVWLKDGRIDCLECASGMPILPEAGEFVFT